MDIINIPVVQALEASQSGEPFLELNDLQPAVNLDLNEALAEDLGDIEDLVQIAEKLA